MSRVAITQKTSRAELGAIVRRALKENLGDDPVLVGGAVVDIYTDGRYKSDDLDIVSWRDNRTLRPVMEKFGFVEKGSYWEHPGTDLLIQFVNPPITIGAKYVKKPDLMATAAGELALLSPLDSACNRLAWYLRDHDPQAIEQCADIVAMQQVPLAAVSRWLRGEPYPEPAKRRAMAMLKKKVPHRR